MYYFIYNITIKVNNYELLFFIIEYTLSHIQNDTYKLSRD